MMSVRIIPIFCGVCVVIVSTEYSLSTTLTMFTAPPTNLLTSAAPTTLSAEDEVNHGHARAMMDYDHEMDHDDEITMEIEEPKAVKADPWAGYYDFLINEGSFKFWAIFQLATAVLLIYSAFAAVYYAKFNPLTSDYDYYDDFFRRRSFVRSSAPSGWFGMDSATFQRIVDAITSKKYT